MLQLTRRQHTLPPRTTDVAYRRVYNVLGRACDDYAAAVQNRRERLSWSGPAGSNGTIS